MGIWAWVQPVNRIWKVTSDHENGKISVYNEKDVLVYEQKGLSKEAVSLIEKNFLGIVATNLSEKDTTTVLQEMDTEKLHEYNYMYA